MNYYLFLLFVTYLWSAWYKNNTGKSLFLLISVTRYFEGLWTLNFAISMSTSYEWNSLHPVFLDSVNITLIAKCLLTVDLGNASFFLEIACQTAFMGVISCGQILWISTKNNTSVPKIWNNVSAPDFYHLKIKCVMEPPSKTICSASSQLVWLNLEVAFLLFASKLLIQTLLGDILLIHVLFSR